MVIFSAAAMLFYCLALVLVTSRLFHVEGPNRKAVMVASGIAVIMHGFALSNAVFTVDGQNFSLTNVISLVNWIIALTFTITMPRLKVIIVVPVVYACSILSVALLWLVPPQFITHFEIHPELLRKIVYEVSMLIQNKLKKKQMMMSPAMPPLMTVEKQLYHLIIIGFILLSLSLVTGFVFLDDMFGDGKGHKAILSIIAWVVYAVMLWQQYTVGCRIRTAVIYSLSGAGLLSLAYFGARVVKELILN